MVWTAPTPRTTGELITASIWNTDVTDNLNALRGGALALPSQAGGDFMYAASPTQLGRLGSVDNRYAPFGGNPPIMRQTIGKQSIWIPASAFRPDLGTPCGPLTNIGQQNIAILGYPFDSTAAEMLVHPGVVLPKAWDRGALSCQIYWTKAGISSGNVIWIVHIVQAYGDGEDFNAYPSYSYVTLPDAAINTKYLHITSSDSVTPGGSPQIGDVVRFAIKRNSPDDGDTLTEDAYFLGLLIVYNTSMMTDD
jgi:hypothetical protein